MPDATEISAKSLLNYWIVGKRLEDREIYMVVSRKDSTLAQVEGEHQSCSSICLLPFLHCGERDLNLTLAPPSLFPPLDLQTRYASWHPCTLTTAMGTATHYLLLLPP